MALRWTDPAVSDLEAVRGFVAGDDPAAAARIAAAVRAAAEILRRFPDLGRPGRRAGTREFVVPRTPLVLIYRSLAGEVDILRVIHGRRQWP